MKKDHPSVEITERIITLFKDKKMTTPHFFPFLLWSSIIILIDDF